MLWTLQYSFLKRCLHNSILVLHDLMAKLHFSENSFQNANYRLVYSRLYILCTCVLVIYCMGFYLWNEEMQWAGLTLGFFLPGTAVQLLSMKWYRDDGDDRRCYLSIIHILHLGIFKRQDLFYNTSVD